MPSGCPPTRLRHGDRLHGVAGYRGRAAAVAGRARPWLAGAGPCGRRRADQVVCCLAGCADVGGYGLVMTPTWKEWSVAVTAKVDSTELLSSTRTLLVL